MKYSPNSSSKSLNKSSYLNTYRKSSPSHTYSFLKLKMNNIDSYSKKSGNKYYYKNPQFLNRSNIQKQINILLTNVSNSQNKKKLPKLIFDEDNKINDVEKVTMNYIQTTENELPKIKTYRKSKYNISKNNKNINKSVDYTYKSIFPSETLFKEKARYINNKLNLIYCQNESQYKYIMEKRNRIKESSKIIEEESEKIKERLNNIKTKVKFIKNVIDYSYPNFLLAKVQIWKKNMAQIKGKEKLLPQEKQKFQQKNKNRLVTNYLTKNLKVYPLKIE